MKKRFVVFGSSLVGTIVLGGIGYGAGLLVGGLSGVGMLDLALGVSGLILGIALGGLGGLLGGASTWGGAATRLVRAGSRARGGAADVSSRAAAP